MMSEEVEKQGNSGAGVVKSPTSPAKSTPSAPAPVLTAGNVSGDPAQNARDTQQAPLLDKYGTGFINYGANKGQQAMDQTQQQALQAQLPAANSLDAVSQVADSKTQAQQMLQKMIDQMFKNAGSFGLGVANSNSGDMNNLGGAISSAFRDMSRGGY